MPNYTVDPVDRAIYETAQAWPGGAKTLALELGLQPGTFSNKCNPNMREHVLNIREAQAMMCHTKNIKILTELARACHHICVPIKDYSGSSDMEILNAWADWDVERSETVTAIRNALSEGKINKRTLDHIHREMFEDFEKELALLERLKSLAV